MDVVFAVVAVDVNVDVGLAGVVTIAVDAAGRVEPNSNLMLR